MSDQPIIVEETFDTPIATVWKAITDKTEMKQWYFDLAEFNAVKGFQFQFTGGPDDGIKYLHLCEVTEVIPGKKLTYSWRYDGNPGNSFVSFDLFEKGSKTLLRLTHEGINTFPKDNPDFAITNFVAGWNDIIHTSLKKYLETAKQ